VMTCDLSDISVQYQVYGEGMPILILHGYAPDHRLMTGCMEPVFHDREGWKRIYPDLPGMGQTRGEDWIRSSDDMLDVTLRFIDAILPDQPFVLAGESYGGYLARGIVYDRAELIDGLDPQDAKEFTSTAVIQDLAHWERFRDEVLPGLRCADEDFLVRVRRNFSFSFDVDAPGQVFDKPALILVGRQDNSTGYRDAWKIIENYSRASFVILDRAGHNLQIEQEALFSVLVHEWLDRVEEAIGGG
jgi:pimeloyl-ACP methyl ester carboxylesterase